MNQLKVSWTKVSFGFKYISKQFSSYLFFMLGLAVAVSGTHLAKLLTGIPVAWMYLWTINYCFNHPEFFRWENLKTKKLAFVLPTVYLLYIVSLFFSHDVEAGLKDLKIKQVLFIYPLALGIAPALNYTQLKKILIVFYFSLLLATLVSYCKLFGLLGFKQIFARQEMAFAISHITYSILFCVAVTSLVWLLFFSGLKIKNSERLLYWFFGFWFLGFLIVLQTFTSLAMLFGLFVFWIFVLIYQSRSKPIKIASLACVALSLLASSLYIYHCYANYHHLDKVVVSELKEKTMNGNAYFHELANPLVENGHFVGLNYCAKEIETEWPKHSKIGIDSADARGGRLRFTLIHYLTSLDLAKDSLGISKLKAEDVKMIERGYSNHIYKKRWSIYPRVYEIIKEFDLYSKGFPAEGHSVIQRVKLFKIAWHLFTTQYFWTGTTTGDLVGTYAKYYEQYESNLPIVYRLRAHNQYLTYLLTYGIVLGICVIVGFVVPLLWREHRQNWLWLSILLLVLLSFVDEDMLETQAGTAIVGLFYPLFLFIEERKGETQKSSRTTVE